MSPAAGTACRRPRNPTAPAAPARSGRTGAQYSPRRPSPRWRGKQDDVGFTSCQNTLRWCSPPRHHPHASCRGPPPLPHRVDTCRFPHLGPRPFLYIHHIRARSAAGRQKPRLVGVPRWHAWLGARSPTATTQARVVRAEVRHEAGWVWGMRHPTSVGVWTDGLVGGWGGAQVEIPPSSRNTCEAPTQTLSVEFVEST